MCKGIPEDSSEEALKNHCKHHLADPDIDSKQLKSFIDNFRTEVYINLKCPRC